MLDYVYAVATRGATVAGLVCREVAAVYCNGNPIALAFAGQDCGQAFDADPDATFALRYLARETIVSDRLTLPNARMEEGLLRVACRCVACCVVTLNDNDARGQDAAASRRKLAWTSTRKILTRLSGLPARIRRATQVFFTLAEDNSARANEWLRGEDRIGHASHRAHVSFAACCRMTP